MPRRAAFYVRGLRVLGARGWSGAARVIGAASAIGAISCSGAADSALFASAGGQEPDAAATNGDASPGESIDGGHATRDSDVPPVDANVSPPADGAATPTDTGTIAPDPEDATEPAADLGIRCGLTTCTPGSNVCCRIPSNAGGVNDTFACLPGSTCAVVPGALAIPCDDATDCAASGHPGGICCASLNAQTGEAESIACMLPQACTSAMQTNLCATNAPAPCPNGGTCKISQTTIPGYDICF